MTGLKMMGSSGGAFGGGQDQQIAQLQQKQNAFVNQQRQKAAQAMANPSPMFWTQPRQVMPQAGILSGNIL